MPPATPRCGTPSTAYPIPTPRPARRRGPRCASRPPSAPRALAEPPRRPPRRQAGRGHRRLSKDDTMPLLVGLDVGSTTVKAVASDAATGAVIWRDYQRHETKQPEKVLEFLHRLQ